MRIIEVIFVISVTLSVIWVLFSRKEKKTSLFILLAADSLICIAHALVDGFRQQMLFVYLALLLLWFFTLLDSTGKISKRMLSKKKRRWAAGAGLSFLVLTIGLLWFFPRLNMPVPTGPYKIGTVSYEATDTDREELYGDHAGENRRIRFQVWYPADSLDGGKQVKWLTDGKKVASGLPVVYGAPSFMMNHMGLIDSSAYSGLTISEQETSYPVVIISHGWTGFMNLHSDLGEMLASYGYIAVSINHTYGAMVTVFDDGEVVYADLNALPDRGTVEDFDKYSHALVNTFALDAQLVLDFLENYPAESGVLGNRLDLDHIGVLGHSTGGGGVVQLAITNPKIKAVFGMDAWVEPISPEILEKGLHIPSAFLRSEQWKTGLNNEFLQRLFNNTTVKPMIYQVVGGNHQDFSMVYMYRPITEVFGFSGSLDILENAAIQQDFVLTFFDQELKNKKVEISALEAEYEAVVGINDFTFMNSRDNGK
ncbi:MAG: dienelactone hydrolase family protein [Spirochaetes bacterium]|nr:dienelactone hydrolase family protein [Spirochaetota bacterium]